MTPATTTLRKLRAAPWILYYKLRSKPPRDYAGQWDDYWGDTRPDGSDVLWDVAEEGDVTAALERLEPHIDRTLPLLDLGCGNGGRSRYLARSIERVIGVDVSPRAIELAGQQNGDSDRVEYRVLDGLDSAAVAALAEEIGPMNIYARGVFHVIHQKDRPGYVANLARLLGDRGVLYQIDGDPEALGYLLAHPGGLSGVPEQMRKVISHGIVPDAMTEDEVERWFPGWELLDSGSGTIHVHGLGDGHGMTPAFYLLARPPARSAGL